MENALLSPTDYAKLQKAVYLLESPSLTIKIANMMGVTLDSLLSKVPVAVQNKMLQIIQSGLSSMIDIAASSMQDNPTNNATLWLHKGLAAVSGGVGGFFGFSAILAELPISTGIMMRSIVDIARSEGFSIQDPYTKIECLTVFSLTGNASLDDDNAKSGYFAARLALGQLTQKAATELLTQTTNASSNALLKLIYTVAQKLNVTLSQKAAAQAIPILGAAAGATLNLMFTQFYQDMATGHFTVKKLEQKYGKALIEQEYKKLFQHYVMQKNN